MTTAGPIGRYAQRVLISGPTGAYDFTIDLTAIRQPNGHVTAMSGETWYFQSWHLDSIGGMAASNFTNAIGLRMP